MKKIVTIIFLTISAFIFLEVNVFADYDYENYDTGLLSGRTPNNRPEITQLTDGYTSTSYSFSGYESLSFSFDEPHTITSYFSSVAPTIILRLFDGSQLAYNVPSGKGEFDKPIHNVVNVFIYNDYKYSRQVWEVNLWGYPTDKQPPKAPTNVKVIDKTATKATVVWNENTEPDLAGYRIYLNGNLVNDSLVTTNQYTFDDLTNGNTYTAQISAVDLAGNESELSAGVTFTPEQDKPPEPPKWLKATPGVEEVILTWTANKEPDLNGYYVYRDGGRISSIVSGTTYTDTGLTPGTEYSYYVTAADAAGHESEPSETVTVTTNTEYAIIPPTNVNATPNRSDMEIIVSWSAVPDATTYKIFKNGLIISETSETSYIDKDVEIGQLYKYRIASVIDGEQSSLSKVAQARILEEFDFENPLNFAAPDIVQTAWNFVKTYDQYVILLLGIIFAPVALGLIVWLQKKVPSSPRTRSRAKGVEVNERQ